jgi:hypothetical protein
MVFDTLSIERLAAWAIAPGLNQNIWHDVVLVDGTPEIMIRMPARSHFGEAL